jgi:hypothetical protein
MHTTRRSARAPKSLRKCFVGSNQPILTFSHECFLVSSAQSTLTNKSRLKLLHRREELLQDLFSKTRAANTTLAQDDARYVKFLQDTIVQGFLQLLEPSVTLHCREQDVDVVHRAGERASKTYKDISGRDVQFDVEGTLNDEWYVLSVPRFLLQSHLSSHLTGQRRRNQAGQRESTYNHRQHP